MYYQSQTENGLLDSEGITKIEWPTQYGQDLIFTRVKLKNFRIKIEIASGTRKPITKITLNYVLKC